MVEGGGELVEEDVVDDVSFCVVVTTVDVVVVPAAVLIGAATVCVWAWASVDFKFLVFLAGLSLSASNVRGTLADLVKSFVTSIPPPPSAPVSSTSEVTCSVPDAAGLSRTRALRTLVRSGSRLRLGIAAHGQGSRECLIEWH